MIYAKESLYRIDLSVAKQQRATASYLSLIELRKLYKILLIVPLYIILY